MKVCIGPLLGHKPYFLCRPFGKLMVSRIRLIEYNPAVCSQLEIIQELLVMLPGLGQPYKFRNPAEGIHHGMYLKTPFFSGSIQPVTARTPQNLAEQLDGAAVNNLQVPDT